jgi:polar amino acid transport system substrate-binding protein
MVSWGHGGNRAWALVKALVPAIGLGLAAAGAWAEESPPMAADSLTLAEDGREIFNNVCGHCHGLDAVQARSKIDLRLLRQRYGKGMEEAYFKTVLEGRPSKGMPAWKDVFTPGQIAAVFAYLNTVQSD